MVKITFFALIILCVVCLMLFATTTLTNGGVVYKTFATHPDTPPSGGLLLWAKTDGTFQTTNSVGTDAGMGGTSSGGAGPIVSVYNTATYADFTATTFTAVPFDTTEYDTSAGGTMHSTSTNTSRLVAPSAGYYSALCSLGMNSGSPFLLAMKFNGATNVGGSGSGSTVSGGAPFIHYMSTSYLHMVANDYVECQIYPVSADHPANGNDWLGAHFQLVKLF